MKYDHAADVSSHHQETWRYPSGLHLISKEQITAHKSLKVSLYCDSDLCISAQSRSFIMWTPDVSPSSGASVNSNRRRNERPLTRFLFCLSLEEISSGWMNKCAQGPELTLPKCRCALSLRGKSMKSWELGETATFKCHASALFSSCVCLLPALLYYKTPHDASAESEC